MVRNCIRCGRRHSGICGIPGTAGVANSRHTNSRRTTDNSGDFKIHRRPQPEKPSTGMLERLLEWAKKEEQKYINMLNFSNVNTREYNLTLNKLDELQERMGVIKRQIVER
ncbi:MAG: hypothetical protein MUO97_01805 [Dehalococcoidia bacterium]|nr:hypothetical protein [Dehalococcoidia bacterium]